MTSGLRTLPCSGTLMGIFLPVSLPRWISPSKNTAGLIMAQREMGHPFVVEFKRRAYEAVKRKN
jgi:hypothetical protein